MNETTKTLVFTGIALVLLAAASLATWLPDWRGSSAAFNEQGEPFFPKFAKALDEDPLAAQVLEVVAYDEETAKYIPFQVELRDGRWTIPSHHDYPADARDKLSRLAAQVAGLSKDAIRSDRAEDHEELGVIDPLDEESTSLKGRGIRVTLRPTPGGEPLADFILGKADPERPGLRYVRLPRKNRTYAAEVDLPDLTTRFADWIETDLVDVNVADATELAYETRKINPDRRSPDGAFLVQPGDPIVLEKAGAEDGGSDWSMEGLGPDERVSDTKVNDVIRAVDGLRIIGVRPLPYEREAILRSMVTKGFYPTEKGLLSNEGGLSVSTDDGLVYTLRFGEVTFAEGDALTAGVGEDEAKADEAEGEDAAEAEGSAEQTEGRYLLVTVDFDEDLIPRDEENANALPDDVFARAPDDPERVAAEKEAAAEAERRERARTTTIEASEKKLGELKETFGNWYYVVSGDDFRKVALPRESFILQPGEEEESTAPPPTPPFDLGGVGGLPPGLGIPGH